MKFKLPTFRKQKPMSDGEELRYSHLLPNWRTQTDAKWYEWWTDRAIREGMKSSSYVYACVNLLCKSASTVPWKVYAKNSSGDWIQQDDHPLQLLIEKPTPWHTRKDLMTGMVSHLYLGGNSIHTKVRANGIIAELWQLAPDWIRVIPSGTDWVDRYEYRKDGIITFIPPDDIMHNKFFDPANPYWGLSPLQAGARAVDIDVEAVKFQKVSLQNRAITDGVFTFEHPLTKDQWDEARKMVRDQHQGLDNARAPWVLGAGATWQQMSMTPAEMDFIESRKMTREEICTVFSVPPPMIGILDQATYNNVETARKIFWMDTVIPLLEDIKDCFNLSLTPEFGDNLLLDYDVSGIEALQESTADKINQAKTLWSMGVPFNEINDQLDLGFDPIEGGDVGYLPSGLLPAIQVESATLPQPTDNPNPQDKPADAQNGRGEDDSTPPKGKVTPLTKSQEEYVCKGINLISDYHKDHYTNAVDRKRSAWVLNMTRRSAVLFKNEADLVIDAVKKGGNYEKAIDGNKAKWETFLKATYQSIADEIGKETFSNLKSFKYGETKDDDQNAFDPYTEVIMNYISEIAGTKITMVSETTKKVIAGLIKQNEENNGTMDDLAKSIKSQYQEFSRYRSYRIARTETQNALGFAQYQAGHQAQSQYGLKIVGEWWTSLDDRVRKSHEELHGEKRELGQPFGNGLIFAGEYKNDQGGANNINCRCVILHHVEED